VKLLRPGGVPAVVAESLIAAIVEMRRRNPRFGCVRIAQQMAHAFGIEIAKAWLTFIGHAKDSLWSLDSFRCESILLRSH
jgi:putative transposase